MIAAVGPGRTLTKFVLVYMPLMSTYFSPLVPSRGFVLRYLVIACDQTYSNKLKLSELPSPGTLTPFRILSCL